MSRAGRVKDQARSAVQRVTRRSSTVEQRTRQYQPRLRRCGLYLGGRVDSRSWQKQDGYGRRDVGVRS